MPGAAIPSARLPPASPPWRWTLSSERSSPANPAALVYPWERERQAQAALADLDLVACRAALESLADEIQLPAGGRPVAVALLLEGLLTRVRSALLPSHEPHPGITGDGTERLRRAAALGGAADLDTLRRVFRAEIGAMFDALARAGELSAGVRRARMFLDQNFRSRVTLQQLAEAVHLSPNYLSAVFRREMGMTVTEYLRWQRTRLAEKLLLEGRHTISEIAYLVGYQNYRDFHRNFVRQAGRSPRAYQQLCRARRPAGSVTAKPPGAD